MATLNYSKLDQKYDSLLKLAAQDPNFIGATEFQKMAADSGIHSFPDDVGSLSVPELIELTGKNLDIIRSLPSNPRIRAGVLAAALNSSVRLADIYDRYKVITRDKDLRRTPRERQKAQKPIELAISEFVVAIGDLDVRKLTKKEGYQFRDKLISDIESGKISASTANKKIMHLRKIINAVFQADYPELVNPFEVKAIEDTEKGRRKPFSEIEIEDITEKLHSNNVNDQLKAIMFVSMFTGAGCKELALLTSSDIVLDADIPHIRIKPNEFRTKVKGGGERHR
ncbi:hypothetical protein [Rhizobium jaguaris]|uniref:hypothetical protein n=1 Tax=Rhizobium jaguaris TaxID=1312183 RepID=UPI0013C4B5BA|nr:hypothetical protein [Rhizobium jaguaris]